jgi:CheY-like chemotaxis protein
MKQILVVDDETLIRRNIKIALANQFLIDESSNGIDAVEKAKEKFFDLILMDLRMPGLGGFEAIMEIRKFSPKTKIIIVSAIAPKNSDAYAVLEKQFGVSKTLIKPFKKEELLNAISEALK